MKWLGQISPRLLGSAGAPQIVLIHGGESTAPKLAAALPGADVTIVYRKGLSEVYDEESGLAKDYPKLPTLLQDVAPAWKPGTPLIVLAFSAGAWALRYYLRDPAARAIITSAIFLDGLYGAPGGVCDLSPYQGVIAYGKEAAASPSTKRLIMTYSQAHPAPGVCSQAIAKAIGPTSSVIVKGYPNADHSAQQGVAGPEVVKQYIAPWLSSGGGLPGSTGLSSGDATSTQKLVLGGLLAAGIVGAVVFWPKRDLRGNPKKKKKKKKKSRSYAASVAQDERDEREYPELYESLAERAKRARKRKPSSTHDPKQDLLDWSWDEKLQANPDTVDLIRRASHMLQYVSFDEAVQHLTEDAGSEGRAYLIVKAAEVRNKDAGKVLR